MKIKTGIIGASGLTGRELIRLLLAHKGTELKRVTSRSAAGRPVSVLFPEFRGATGLRFERPGRSMYKGLDLVFICLPHAESMEHAAKFVRE